ncbi:MAG TPA: GNAT family N-acetyltransferase [Candidatus Nanopelagicales bacterium]|nr:GNAT family N-acetyltransferase [Candidatus Nanopelagicales bacterium]
MIPPSAKILPVEIRVARPEEYQAAGQLVEQAYRDGGELSGGPEHAYGAVLRDVAGRAPDSQVLVAFRGGAMVGTVTVMEPGTRHAQLAQPGELEFRFLGVARDAWGSGVADALVTAILAAARSHGWDTIIGVREGNRAADRLYARHGFDPVPARDWSPMPDVRLRAYVHRYRG